MAIKGSPLFRVFSSFHAMSTFSSIEYLNNHWVRESLSTDAIFSSDIDLHLIVVFLSPGSEIDTTKRIGWCRSPALKLYVKISSTSHSKLSTHSQILSHVCTCEVIALRSVFMLQMCTHNFVRTMSILSQNFRILRQIILNLSV